MPKNLQQIQYRVKRLAFSRHRKKIYTFHKRMLRHADPGHTELWSFGWVHNYRDHMPFYPLPGVTFAPYIITYIDQLLPTTSHITIDIRPFDESMILSSYEGKSKYTLPFFTNSELNKLCTLAELYRPSLCTKNMFEQKVSLAMEQATREKKAEWQLL